MRLEESMVVELLEEQKTTKEIIAELKKQDIDICPRQWRDFVERYNGEYDSHERYIASDNKGYFLTTESKAITITNIRKIRVAIAMLKNAKADLKELSEKNQLSLMESDIDIYDTVLKLGI